MKSSTSTATAPLHSVYTGPDGATSLTEQRESYRKTVFVPSQYQNVRGDRKKPNAFQYEIDETWASNGVYEYVSIQGFQVTTLKQYGCFGDSTSVSHVSLSYLDSPYDKCLSKLNDAVRNSEVSIATTVGEGRETLQMIRDLGEKCAKAEHDLRRVKKRFKKNLLQKPLQTLGGLQLYYSVGLAPLLSDVNNLVAHVMDANPDLVFRVAQARAATEDRAESAPYSDSTGKNVLRTRGTQRYEMQILYKIRDVHSYENWRLGLTLRPTLAWELLTLSFVVDYFVTVGAYLENLEAAIGNNGVEFQSGYVTCTEQIETVKTIDWQRDPPQMPVWTSGFEWVSDHRRARRRTIRLSRTVLTSWPLPHQPRVKIPRAAGPLLNVASLLAQLLK